MRALRVLKEDGYDRRVALTVALLAHLMLLCLFWDGTGPRAGNVEADGGDGSSIVTVEFIAVSPRAPVAIPATAAQPAVVPNNADADQAAASDATPVKALPTTEGDPIAANSADAAATPERARRADLGAPPDARTEVSSAAESMSGPQGEAGTAANDGLEGRYLAAIKRSIAAHWTPTSNRMSGGSCTLTVYQVPGGQVKSAMSGDCALGPDDRHRLEAAALMAQPLPYRGFESVFREELVLKF